jgi:hypothetical protein
VNVAALVVLVAASVAWSVWVVPAGVVVYVLLVAASARDQQARLPPAKPRGVLGPAGRSLAGITGTVRQQVVAALREEQGILAELERSDVAPAGLGGEVMALCDDLVVWARRASEVDTYLRGVDDLALRARRAQYAAAADGASRDAAAAIDDQLAVIGELRTRRAALEAEITHLAASLGAIHARLLQAQSQTPQTGMVTGDVTQLRDQFRAIAESVAEAYGQNADTNVTKGT